MEEVSALRDLITAIAREHGLLVACDTHYDASNFELFWWQGVVRHSVDVQPYPDGRLTVTAIQTAYPAFPRFWAWAKRSIPLFPAPWHIRRQPLGALSWPCPPDQLR